jgi:hypothetical protein
LEAIGLIDTFLKRKWDEISSEDISVILFNV